MKPDEIGRVCELVVSLQTYQKMKIVPRLPTREDLSELVQGREKPEGSIDVSRGTFVVVAIDKENPNQKDSAYIVGYQIYTQAFSITHGRHMYVNSFFIEEGYRRHGLGRKFMEFMQGHARSTGNTFVDIPVMNDNVPGHKFYKGYNAQSVDDEYDIMYVNVN